MREDDLIIKKSDPILVTGSTGFIGTRLVNTLLSNGFYHLRCIVRPSSDLRALRDVLNKNNARAEIIEGNLLAQSDCDRATDGVSVIFHLAAGRGDKSYPNAFLNSVVTTRNILSSSIASTSLKRFLNVSSFVVYSNQGLKHNEILDEKCPMEKKPVERGEAYCYAKVRQDEVVMEYGAKHHILFSIVRPGFVYGPGNMSMTGRVGIGTFGLFLHLGGSNIIPFTYVDNCADAIALVGLTKGCDGEVFNIVDDDCPTSRKFLRLYKKNMGGFSSLYLPRSMSYFLCYLWEKYSDWSKGQLPPVFNRNRWSANWKGNRYSNKKLKAFTGWEPRISFDEGSRRYFEYLKNTRRAK
jgi:nucleoside-diphosphate-sugar epimerase